MAITATVTDIGMGDYLVALVGASVTATMEVEITGLPLKGRVRRQKTSITSGTGTTVDPIIGTATAPATTKVVVENGTPAADVDNQHEGEGWFYYSATGSLFHRDRADAGADNVTASEYLISEGWGDRGVLG